MERSGSRHGMRPYSSVDLSRSYSVDAYSKRHSTQVNSLVSPTLPPFMNSHSNEFLDIQEKTFRKWLNAKLESAALPPMRSLEKDLSDGVRLIQLMEIMSGTSLGRFNRRPIMRVQRAENIQLALSFIKSRGVMLTNIGPEDIIDGNLKLILGMIWTLILRFTIADIAEEGKTAKDGLLLWCQRMTHDYAEVDVQDFHKSWKDGLPFCALIHKHRPDLIDYNALDKTDAHYNTRVAFDAAEKALGIPQLLDVSDVVDVSKPDERSVMTYVAELFLAFSDADKVQSATRRLVNFAEITQSIWVGRSDYERRAFKLMDEIRDTLTSWKGQPLSDQYAAALDERNGFLKTHRAKKRDWTRERSHLETLLGNVVTKLKTYSMAPYRPPEGLSPMDIDALWTVLLDAEAARSKAINANIRDIKERLRLAFADEANAAANELNQISTRLSVLDGSLEAQLSDIRSAGAQLQPIFENRLPLVQELAARCDEAKIEDNDYTTYSFEDLAFEAQLVQESVLKKASFVENQMVARKQTNLTPAQLEEFESVFRHFDANTNNTLDLAEFGAALSALGFNYTDSDTEDIHARLSDEEGSVSFESYLQFLVDVCEDTFSPTQILGSCQEIANGKSYITSRDLELAKVPADLRGFLSHAMPQAEDAPEPDAYDFQRLLSNVYGV